MPMHMGITLLAAQTEQIGTFDFDRRFHCPRHPGHQSHQLEVSVLSEIPHDVLMMDLRSHSLQTHDRSVPRRTRPLPRWRAGGRQHLGYLTVLFVRGRVSNPRPS